MMGDPIAIARLQLGAACIALGCALALLALAGRRLDQAQRAHREERATLGAEVERLEGVLLQRGGRPDRPDYIAPADGPAEANA